jgi:putative DNA primase/helicase
MSKIVKPRDGGDKTSLNPLSKKSGRKRPKGASETTENKAPKRATDPAGQIASWQLRPRTAEDISNAQTVESLALRIWTAMVAEKVLSGMSALMDELLESHLLDDDDEEADESWLDDHHKREKKLLDEAIADGLDKYPDINAINDLPPSPDPDIARDAEQLKDYLAKCPIGATELKVKFSRPQIERIVKRRIEDRFKKDPKYSKHVREDVPGSDIKKYGSRGCTSSKGTFCKSADYQSGGGLAALFTGGWTRVCKDRIDPIAWSHQSGFQRKTERQNWRHHFLITERNGNQSPFEIPREKLAGNGAPAIRLLMKGGVHVVARDVAQKALVQFLRFKPRQEIIRMPRVGWAQVGSHWIFVRPDEVITPPGMPMQRGTTYVLDTAATRHGLHVAGTTAAWVAEIAAPLRGNSNIALSLGTFLAAPLLCFASEPGGGKHLYGPSTIGKTMASALGQSIYGWPHEMADDAFGVSWGGTEAGFDALALARTDLGLPLDEITLANPRTAEQVVYKVASGTKGPRATSTGDLRVTAHAYVLVLSTGEKPLAQFIGRSLQDGARKRLVDVPAEVQPGSVFETIPREQIHTEGKRLFGAIRRQHGAIGRDWQRHLVALGPNKIKKELQNHREAFLALPEVVAVAQKAHPQVRAVVNRFALYAAALRMAIATLLPWTVEESDAGIIACMRRWVQQRGNLDSAGEVVRAAREFERELVARLGDHFIHIHKLGAGGWTPATEADEFRQRTPERFDGYVKPDRILIRPEAFRQYCNGSDPGDIARHLRQRGVLIADGNSMSKSEQVIGRTQRFYVVSRASLTPDALTGKFKPHEKPKPKSRVRLSDCQA